MVHYSNSSLGGALKSPGKNRLFALTFACHGERTIAPTVPQGAMDLGVALGDLLRAYCQAHGIDWQGEGLPFLHRLQPEALHNLVRGVLLGYL